MESNYREQPRERVRTKEREKYSSSAEYFIEYFSTWVHLLGIRNTLDIVDGIQILLGTEHTALNTHWTLCVTLRVLRGQLMRDRSGHIVE